MKPETGTPQQVRLSRILKGNHIFRVLKLTLLSSQSGLRGVARLITQQSPEYRGPS